MTETNPAQDSSGSPFAAFTVACLVAAGLRVAGVPLVTIPAWPAVKARAPKDRVD